MELTGKEMRTLFPTALFSGKLSDITACDRAEAKLREMQKAGQGYAQEYIFITPDDLQNLPEMKELADLIMKESAQVLDVYKIKRDSHYITNMWANITHPNHRHHMHIHPNCLFSGILYIKAPKNCGPTILSDPRLNSRMIEPTYTELNVYNISQVVTPAEKGRMLIWPSYLPHAVEYGTAKEDEDRIVIAFNIMIRGVMDQRTARLELK